MSRAPSMPPRMGVAAEPSNMISPELLPHVHLVSSERFPQIAQVSLEQVVGLLQKAPVLRDTQSVHWMYLNTPPAGTLMLVWQNHNDFGTDGYVWATPEASFTQEYRGYTIEMRVQKCGYISPAENVTKHSRARYRIVGSASNTAFDPMMWVVHYSHASSRDQIPINRIQLPPQIQQLLAMRRALQSHGAQLTRRDFWLHDRNTWPVIGLPPQMHQAGYAQHVMGRPGAPGQGLYPQAGMAQSQAKAARARGGLTGVLDYLLEDEETATGDILDVMSPRDISSIRYKTNHEWMEEIFASPYRSNQITPVDLGLGKKGELAALTMPFFNPPVLGRPVPGRGEKDEEGQGVKPYIGKLPPGKAEEFKSAATKKVAEIEADMERMKKRHAKRLEKMQRLKRLSEAETALREAFVDPADVGTEVWRVEGHFHDARGDVVPMLGLDSNQPRAKVADIVTSLENALHKSVVPVAEVTLVQKGGIQDKGPTATTAQGDAAEGRDLASEDVNMEDTPAQQGGDVVAGKEQEAGNQGQGGAPAEGQGSGGDVQMGGMDEEQTTAARGQGDESWVMVSKEGEAAAAQPTSGATEPTTTTQAGDATTAPPSGPPEQSSTLESETQPGSAPGPADAPNTEAPAPESAPAATGTADAPPPQAENNQEPTNPDLEPSHFDEASGFSNIDSAGDALAAFSEEQQSGLDLEGFQNSEFGDAFAASEHRDDTDMV